MIKIQIFLLSTFLALGVIAQRPKPTPQQLAWHKNEFYLFMHFGPNTFTGKEWGHGDEKTAIFNPDSLDTDQWCRIAKAAGATGIIITAKHHDGFCLWPSKFSTHTVRESPWKDGKGDVLKDLSASCKKWGLQFGVYLSPWDRNHPLYGTPQYNEVFVNMMTEVLTQYGSVWELWWDGANGEGPNGKKQIYDFPLFEKTVRRLSPNTVIFSDVGPDIRWVGNEQGFASITNWNTLTINGFLPGAAAPPTDTLHIGNVFGDRYIPAEVDVSIRPGWFFHAEENTLVKTPAQLYRIYLNSVGRGANLLLNVPPDDHGRIHTADAAALIGFKQIRDQVEEKKISGIRAILQNDQQPMSAKQVLDNKLQTDVRFVGNQDVLVLHLPEGTPLSAICLQENVSMGQHCASFYIELLNNNQRVGVLNGTTMGNKRIISIEGIVTNEIRIHIQQQYGITSIAEVAVYKK